MSGSLRRFISLKSYFLPSLVLMIATLIRVLYVLKGPALSDQIWSDMQIYTGIANDIGEGVWKKTHFFQSIGYPYVILFLRQLTPNYNVLLAQVQAVASCLTVLFMYFLVLESFGKRIALISLVISSLHLPWILYESFALPETLFTFLLSVCAWCSIKIVKSKSPSFIYPFLWGATFIGAFWLKGTHIFWGPIFFAGLLLLKRFKGLYPAWILGLVVASGLLSHGLLSFNKTGNFQFSASAGGLNFVEGKCPHKKNSDSAGFTWQSPLYYQLDLFDGKNWNRPFTESKYFFKQGIQCIKRDPYVLIQSLESIPYLFVGNTMWPFNVKPVARYTRLHELYYGLFVVIGLFIYFLDFNRRRDYAEALVWIAPVMAVFLCVYIFKSEIRYRAPFDIWFIPLGVKGWAILLHQFKTKTATI